MARRKKKKEKEGDILNLAMLRFLHVRVRGKKGRKGHRGKKKGGDMAALLTLFFYIVAPLRGGGKKTSREGKKERGNACSTSSSAAAEEKEERWRKKKKRREVKKWRLRSCSTLPCNRPVFRNRKERKGGVHREKGGERDAIFLSRRQSKKERKVD